MTLQTAWFRYHLNDNKLNKCTLKHFSRSDVYNVKIGKKPSNYSKLMNYMVDEEKRLKCFVNNPYQNQVQNMYNKVSKSVSRFQAIPDVNIFFVRQEKNLYESIRNLKK